MTKLETLQDVFKDRAFRVPDYQRGYAWGDEQRQDLLDDLENVESHGYDRVHYTGTLVMHRHDTLDVLGTEITILDIVDGQQRLTTLLVLLRCIIIELCTLGPAFQKKANHLSEQYLAFEELPRLELERTTDVFFREHVINGSLTIECDSPARHNLKRAKLQFLAYLDKRRAMAGHAEQEWSGVLSNLLKTITNRLGFVYYEVKDEAEVGVMFEVMNSRGKPLTDFEKVKNYLLYTAAKVSDTRALAELTTNVNETWHFVLNALSDSRPELLGEVEEDRFLRYHWIIYPGATFFEDGSPAKTYDIHKAIKKTLRTGPHVDGMQVQHSIQNYLKSMRDLVTAFRDLRNPSHPKAFLFGSQHRNELIEWAGRIRNISRSATFLPLLMAAHQTLADNPKGLVVLLKQVEAFVFRLVILDKRSQTGAAGAYGEARRLMVGQTDLESLMEWLRTHAKYYCSDEQLIAALRDPNRNFYEWSGLKYFFYEYERHIVQNTRAKFPIDWSKFNAKKKEETIEHVLPQGENTLELIPYWRERFDPDSWARHRHRLGNLVVSDWNVYYTNKAFPEKRGAAESSLITDRVYRNSTWFQERLLAGYEHWTPQDIETRQEDLAEFGTQRWAI